jgi:hypothetical protein
MDHCDEDVTTACGLLSPFRRRKEGKTKTGSHPEFSLGGEGG